MAPVTEDAFELSPDGAPSVPMCSIMLSGGYMRLLVGHVTNMKIRVSILQWVPRESGPLQLSAQRTRPWQPRKQTHCGDPEDRLLAPPALDGALRRSWRCLCAPSP